MHKYFAYAIPVFSIFFQLTFLESVYANEFSSVRPPHIDSLDPKNRQYLENYCRFHPTSGLCYFTPNPVAKSPLTPPVKLFPGTSNSAGFFIPPQLGLVAGCTGSAEKPNVTAGSFLSAVSRMGSGQVLVLAPGTYPGFSIKGRSLGGAHIRCAEAGKCILKPTASTINIENSSGITLDGFSITGGGRAIGIIDSQNITVRCSNFISQAATGILIYGKKAANIQLHKNNFRNDKEGCSVINKSVCGGMLNGVPRPLTDYGVRVYDAQSIDVRENNWDGLFAHGISLKYGVKYANVSDNTFGTCGRHCIQFGQESNTTTSGYRSVGTAIANNNTFLASAKYRLTGVYVMNVEKATVTNNKFAGPGKFIRIKVWDNNEKDTGIGASGYPVNNGIPKNRQIIQSGNTGS